MTVRRTTISNSAEIGMLGTVGVVGTLLMENSTISGTPTSEHGFWFIGTPIGDGPDGEITIRHSTITDHSDTTPWPGAVAFEDRITATLDHVIASGNHGSYDVATDDDLYVQYSLIGAVPDATLALGSLLLLVGGAFLMLRRRLAAR